MAEERHRVDMALKQATTRMDAALKAQSAVEFKLGLRQLTATVNRQVQQTNDRISDVSGVVQRNKVAQAKVNANVNAEMNRMIKLGKKRYDEHMKKDAELKKLIDSNKAATDARMKQMSAHYMMELDAVRSTMKKNRAHASKMLGKQSAKLYAAIAKSEAAQTKVNGELRTQTREATAAIRDELKAAKADFSRRIGALSKTVVANQKKFQGKFDHLTGVVRANAVKSAKGRAELAQIMASNKKDLESDVSAATKATLSAKIKTEISQYAKEAHNQIEGLRFNSKKAREEMRAELTQAVRGMAKEAKENLDKEAKKAAAAFVAMNAKEDAAAAESAAGRAALGQQIVKEREAAKEALSNTVATLQRSMLAR